MHDDFHQLLKKFPLIASKNRHLDLLNEEELARVRVRQSDVYRRLWGAQKKKIARYSADPEISGMVKPAERFRDHTRAHPVTSKDDIEWPVFDSGKAENPFHCPTMTPGPSSEAEQLFDRISRQLAFSLSHPCPVFEDRYSVRVEFLDRIAWVALKIERVLKMEIRDENGDWQLSTLRFDLMTPLHTKSWIDQVLLAWVADIVLLSGEEAETTCQWLRREIGNRFHNPDSLGGIRQQVRHHMSVAPGMIEACLHVKRQSGARKSLMTSDVNEMWHAAEFWAELHEKFPQLTLLCYLATKGNKVRPLRDLSEVRSRCLEHGLSPAGWRYLLKVGEPCYQAVVNSGMDASRAFSTAIGLIDWQSRSGVKQALPQDMALAFINFTELALLDGLKISELVNPRLARIAVNHYRSLPRTKDRTRFVEKDWLEVLIWLRNAQPRIDKNQWRAGWPSIWKTYETWLLGRDSAAEWDPRAKEIMLSGIRVVPLTSSRELCLEGMKMNNCVSTYARACRADTYRVFSLRMAETDKRIATVGLCWSESFWRLAQVSGPNNREVSAEIKNLAQSLAKLYQQTNQQYRDRVHSQAFKNRSRNGTGHDGFYLLKVSAEGRLLSRAGRNAWEVTQPDKYPVSSELRTLFGPGAALPENGAGAVSPAELALRLRLELPAEYSVYIWDAVEQRDRALSLS